MGGVTKRRVAGVAITGMVVAGIVGVTSLSASGQATNAAVEAAGPVLAPYGTLTINLTDRDGTYTLVDPEKVPIKFLNPGWDEVDPDSQFLPNPETIATTQPCAAVEPGSGGLLVLIPNPDSPTSAADTVQLRNSGVGVNTGNTSCGSSAAATLSGSEQLKIELGPMIPAGVYVKSAKLQVTQLKKGELKVALDDGPLVEQPTISQSPQEFVVAPAIAKVEDLFTNITLESTSNKDNEGLALFDGTSFELVTLDPDFEVAVDCGEQVTEIGDIGDIATSAVFFRGANGSKTSGECVDVGVIVDIVSDQWVFWDNSNQGVDGSAQAVNGTVTIEWAPVSVADAAQLERVIDYDGPGPGPFTPSLWCESFDDSQIDADGDVKFVVVLPDYDGFGSILVDGVEKAPWCLVSDERIVQDDGTILQTEVLFGSGDPRRTSPS